MTGESFNDCVRIDVLICTYRRSSVEETLRSIDDQHVPDNFVIRAIVADNDDGRSAERQVLRAATTATMPVLYVHAPARNISIARNACLDAAEADWIAFIDDDEIASPSWLRALLQVAEGGDYDAVFGPVIAEYGADAPQWIRRRDYHSTWPEMRGGVVQTGYAGNVLLRWKGAPYQKERFLPEKGRTGGEDTEFFFRLWRKGARFGIAEDATVREAVDPGRLNFRWLSSRKFRAGQSYGRHAVASERHRQAGLAVAAATKVVACGAMALGAVFSMADRRYWALRGIFHCGVLAAQFGGREIALYGT